MLRVFFINSKYGSRTYAGSMYVSNALETSDWAIEAGVRRLL